MSRHAWHRVDQYAADVLDGTIVTGPLVRLACERHVADVAAATARGFWFDPASADHIIGFFEDWLRLPDMVDEDGDPMPFLLQPWQAFIIGSIFGWRWTSGHRRFRNAYIEVGKGNGKSLDVATPILTVDDGWTTMGDLIAGDRIFDARGRATTVLAAYAPVEGRACYQLVFEDGASVVADDEHLWVTTHRRTGVVAAVCSAEIARDPDGDHVIQGGITGTERRRVIGCFRVAPRPVRCIAVEAPSHLYLAGPSCVPTHNTPLLAGVGLYGLTMDGQVAPQIYAAAVDRDQAMIMFRDAVRIVDASPALKKRVRKSGIEVVHNLSYGLGFFRPFSREQGSKSGTRPHMGLIDEVHEHPHGDVINKIRAGAKNNEDALFAEITNSGTDRTSICWQHHEHSQRILEGTVEDDRWFAYVCTLAEGDDPLADESCWPKVNPNLGVSIQNEYLRDQVSSALNIAAETNTVLRLNFCVWTQAHVRYLNVSEWHACALAEAIDPALLVGRPCFAGLDLGQSDDFSAFVRIWLLADGRIYVQPTFWIPEGALVRHPHRPYAQWQRVGALIVIRGADVVDYQTVQDDVQQMCDASAVREVGYDKRFAEQMAQNLGGFGITMINVPQGWNLTEAMRKLSDLVTTGPSAFVHDGNPVMGWMAANLVAKLGPNKALRPDKDKAAEKIDGQVALVQGLDAVIRQAPEPQYEVLFLGGGAGHGSDSQGIRRS